MAKLPMFMITHFVFDFMVCIKYFNDFKFCESLLSNRLNCSSIKFGGHHDGYAREKKHRN